MVGRICQLKAKNGGQCSLVKHSLPYDLPNHKIRWTTGSSRATEASVKPTAGEIEGLHLAGQGRKFKSTEADNEQLKDSGAGESMAWLNEQAAAEA